MNKAEILDRFYENMATMKRAMHGKMDSQTGNLPISHSQMALLFALRECQPISPKRLAARLHLTAGAVSQLVESLTDLKLIERSADPNDRRGQILKVSRNGQSTLKQIEKSRRKILKSILEDLSIEELTILLKVQEKLTRRFSDQNPTEHNK